MEKPSFMVGDTFEWVRYRSKDEDGQEVALDLFLVVVRDLDVDGGMFGRLFRMDFKVGYDGQSAVFSFQKEITPSEAVNILQRVLPEEEIVESDVYEDTDKIQVFATDSEEIGCTVAIPIEVCSKNRSLVQLLERWELIEKTPFYGVWADLDSYKFEPLQ